MVEDGAGRGVELGRWEQASGDEGLVERVVEAVEVEVAEDEQVAVPSCAQVRATATRMTQREPANRLQGPEGLGPHYGHALEPLHSAHCGPGETRCIPPKIGRAHV